MPMNKTHDYHEFLEQCKMLYQITKRKISIGLLMFSHYRLDKESEYTLSEEKLEQILNELDSDVFRIDLCTVNKCGRGKQQKLSNKIASNLLKIVKYKGFEGKIFPHLETAINQDVECLTQRMKVLKNQGVLLLCILIEP